MVNISRLNVWVRLIGWEAAPESFAVVMRGKVDKMLLNSFSSVILIFGF
jgi:hypothetical protein